MANVGVSIKVAGVTTLLHRARALPGVVRQAAVEAQRDEAGAVIARANADFVPIDQGDLRDTGRVEEVEGTADGFWVRLAYGSDEVDYAVIVHEDLEARHEHGSAKYLEIPALEAAAGMPQRVAARVRAAIARL